MNRRFVVVGTDTGVGKTIFSAALVGALDAFYWKPVQAGLDDETDSQTVARLSGVSPSRILPEKWRLRQPASPNLAARAEGVVIDIAEIDPPPCDGDLIIETAGGVMSPLADDALPVDLLARWRFPAVIVARTTLGTINHSLLTIGALRSREIPIIGIAFVGAEEQDVQRTIAQMGRVRLLGRLPRLSRLECDTLRVAFDAEFDLKDFT